MSIIGVIQTGGSGNAATVVNNSDTQASARELKRELLRAQAEHWMALWGWTCALEMAKNDPVRRPRLMGESMCLAECAEELRRIVKAAEAP